MLLEDYAAKLKPENMQKACDAGDGAKCNDLGAAYSLERDEGRAAEFFRKSCDLSNGTGCRNLGKSYDDGRGPAQDRSKAAELYKKACGLGDAKGCLALEALEKRRAEMR